MSLDGLRVNHPRLEAAAQDMFRTVKNLERILDDLEKDINTDVKGWTGVQQESYLRSKAAWDWAMTEMRDLLDKSQQTVMASNAEYINADKRGASRFTYGGG